ncbi:S-adenosylmethionine sensor upstream of mTORC1-like isoform X3 [Uloborus diversus]|uniref:S-adenosylmethionine sensor upstream of mTORC1-like isoform X3 n=1 Tax=Uloborus diversus TaxID=327109 RepID=UPI002408F966|nr:S-adenosylmethionine sensor upstream of mTORC1-like isoform X3 [Uloborus diversus]
MSAEHQDLVNIIRGVHDKLRKAVRNVRDIDKVWADHLADEETRKKYSSAMLKLATEVWSEKGESRIQWSYNTCIDYFFGQGLKRCLLRAARKKKIQFMKKSDILYSLNDEDLYLMPNNYENITRKLKLLDVGSCYNPFSKFSEFSCAAIDLTPATECLNIYQSQNKELFFVIKLGNFCKKMVSALL